MPTTETMRERLEAEAARLRREIETTHDQTQAQDGPNTEISSYGNHPGDQAAETFEDTKLLALETNSRRRLEDVEAALGRINQGTFGRCANCGREIAPERLEAMPWVAECIDCRRSAEERA